MVGDSYTQPDFVWALRTVFAVHKKPFDTALLLQQFPPPHDDTNLVSADQTLTFECQLCKVTADQLRQSSLPSPLPLLVELISSSPPSLTTAISQSASFQNNKNDWGKTAFKSLWSEAKHAGRGRTTPGPQNHHGVFAEPSAKGGERGG